MLDVSIVSRERVRRDIQIEPRVISRLGCQTGCLGNRKRSSESVPRPRLLALEGTASEDKELADRIGLDVKPKRDDTIDMKVLKGVIHCFAGGYSVEAVLMLPESKGLKHIA